jgi:hypothetical protein
MNHKNQKNLKAKEVHYLKNLPRSLQFSNPKSLLDIEVRA